MRARTWPGSRRPPSRAPRPVARTGAVRSIDPIEGYRLDREDDGLWGPAIRGERLSDGKPVEVRVVRLGGDFDHEVRDALQYPPVLALAHPHCVAVLEAGRRGRSAPVAIVEHHDHETLRSVIARGPLPIASALALLGQVLDGLAHAHDHGVIHGYVDAELIGVTATAVGLHARIDGFETVELRQILGSGSRRFINCKSGWLPPVLFHAASPERWQGRGYDARADLYAAGVMLYEAVTARRLYDPRGDLQAMFEAIVHAPTPRLAEHVAADVVIPRGLQEIFDTAMAKSPADRFATARAFRDAIAALRD